MNRISTLKELKSFLFLWLSQTVSELGTAMTDYALVIWTYQKTGMASSVTMLTFCMFLPTILFRFIAGTYVDRRNKKRIMLTADLIAALSSLLVLGLYTSSILEIWHLYLINIVLSFMNSFQESASFVAISLIVPQKHYARIGGLQGISGSIVAILAPALGSILLVLGGLRLVLICDLVSCAAAFLVLLFLVKIPEIAREEKSPVDLSFLRVYLLYRSDNEPFGLSGGLEYQQFHGICSGRHHGGKPYGDPSREGACPNAGKSVFGP